MRRGAVIISLILFAGGPWADHSLAASPPMQRPPAPPAAKPDDSLTDFTTAIELLRDIVRRIAVPYLDESGNPLTHVLVAPQTVRVRGTFQLSRQQGKPGFILVRPTESSLITLEIEAAFDVATGQMRVQEAKRILVGEKK